MQENDQELKSGDLVVLAKSTNTDSMTMWSSWNDLEYSTQEIKFWPIIIGSFKKEETAIVLEVYSPKVGQQVAKIYTSKQIIGWIDCKCLALGQIK